MSRFLENAVAVAAICALTAIGVCAVEAGYFFAEMRQTSAQLAGHVSQSLARVDATVADLDRTVQIAGGAINEARKIERDNRAEIAAANRETLATLRHVDALIVSFDQTQQQAGKSIADTSAALVPVIAQAGSDLAAVKPAIEQVTPLLEKTTDIAANVSNATADVEHEIHKLVYPPPRKWYQKYFIDPLKIAAHLVTIPLR